ncbi:MAG: hypothetical protein GX927_00285 [Lentisphaerae bacterium]|jgi:WD40 repeat protein|nr:hypothetical protein [Lentisphaerota bacterium]
MKISQEHLPARRISPEKDICFFGYYDKYPCSASGEFHLAHRVGFQARQPRCGEAAELGFLRDGQFVAFGSTCAWNWQQGSMLQWFDQRHVLFNDLEQGKHVARRLNPDNGECRTLDRPVYTLSPDRKYALSLNFSRLDRERPGYGYHGADDPTIEYGYCQNDGVFLMDLEAGQSRVVVSLARLVESLPDVPEAARTTHWVNHMLFSPDGKRFSFLHRYRVFPPTFEGMRYYRTRLLTARVDGSDLRELQADGHFSHYVWSAPERILAASRLPEDGTQYRIYDVLSGKPVQVVAANVFPPDGHCSFSPDGRWMLTDSYVMPDGCRKLYLMRMGTGEAFEIGSFRSNPDWPAPTRCDLHPRWMPDGRSVSIDSIHEGTRGIYHIDLKGIIAP